MENPALLVPEVMAFFAGTFLTLLLWLGFFSRAKKSQHDLEILQRNLAKVNLAWSTNESSWVPLADHDAERDQYREKRSYIILAVIMVLTSWFGFFFSLVLMASFKWLPSRKERQIMSSALVRDIGLTAAQVQQALDEVSV